MSNKIILKLKNGTEIEKKGCSFISLVGDNNVVKLKMDSEEAFDNLKGLLLLFCIKKYSTRQKTLEIFVSKFYKEITNVVNMSVFKQIEYLRKIS